MVSLDARKFYVSVDLEGVACAVGSPGQGLGNGANYSFAVERAAVEASSAVRALLDLGAAEVWVWDSHGTGVNLDYSRFNKKCRFVIGSGCRTRFPMIDESFGGVLLIGYHAYDAPDATLAHVYSSSSIQYMKINSRFVGEADIDAAFAARHGVPLIFASGDNIFTSQIRDAFPDCKTVTTKTALGWNCCLSKHPAQVEHEIYEKVLEVCAELDSIEVYPIGEPFEFEVRYKRIESAQNCPYRTVDGGMLERVDAYTCRGLCRLDDLF